MMASSRVPRWLILRPAAKPNQMPRSPRRFATTETSWPSEIARVYAFRGEKDHAFEWLDRAYEARDEDLYIIKGDPLFKNLEGDPRYKAFLQEDEPAGMTDRIPATRQPRAATYSSVMRRGRCYCQFDRRESREARGQMLDGAAGRNAGFAVCG